MNFEQWWKEYDFRSMDPGDSAEAAWNAAIEEAAKHCEKMGEESSRAYAAFDQCAESMRLLLKTPHR